MACGVGACLGCSCAVKDTDGSLQYVVCKDGPVFGARRFAGMNRVDMSVSIAGLKLKNPVMTASGTFGLVRNTESFTN